jgi:hypothetical protein
VNWYGLLSEMIDLGSFSNLWFWIALAVLWSTASHWVLGVPYDLLQRAERQGGQAEVDLEDLTRIYVNRLLYISGVSGLWLVGFTCFVLTMLVILGFGYDQQFAQALFLMGFPLTLVSLFSLATARRIREEGATGARLRRLLSRQRIKTQIIGMVSIVITAFWGMSQNLSVRMLDGLPHGQNGTDGTYQTDHSRGRG